MPLPPFLKRKDTPAARSRPAADGAEVQLARVRARRRLIGAAVLLVLGVIAFPLLFETQPRTIPVDIPIEAVVKDGAAPAVPKTGSVNAPPLAADLNANVVLEPPALPASAPAQAQPPAPPKAAPTVAALEPAKEPPAAPPASATAAAEPKATRFVVQVGAFAEGTAARDVRLKVERLGLKTFTQVVDTAGGKRTRVRIGPFESREEAAKVLGQLKAANLPGAVLAL